MGDGLDTILWRSHFAWQALTEVATGVVQRWNAATPFVVNLDKRECIWTVRHASVSQPFLVLNADSLRGSVARIGNPLPVLLLFGMAHDKPGCVEMSFADGRAIKASQFDLADLTDFLPLAIHPAHRTLAELAFSDPAAS